VAADGRLAFAAAILEADRAPASAGVMCVGALCRSRCDVCANRVDGTRVEPDSDAPLLEALCRTYLAASDLDRHVAVCVCAVR
jgi:hypothetical protein